MGSLKGAPKKASKAAKKKPEIKIPDDLSTFSFEKDVAKHMQKEGDQVVFDMGGGHKVTLTRGKTMHIT